MTGHSNEALVGVIDQVLRTTTAGPLLVIPAMPRTDGSSEYILSRFSNVGLMFDDGERQQLPRQPRVGRRYGPYFSSWELPEGTYRNALIVATPESLGFRALLSAFRGGVRKFLFLSPTADVVVPASTMWLMSSVLARKCADLVRHIAVGIVLRVRRLITALAARAPVKVAIPAFSLPFQASLKSITQRYKRAATRRRNQNFETELKRLFAFADRIRDGGQDESRRVALAVGTVGPGGSERQVVNTAIALSASGQYRPVVMCSNLSSSTSSFYRPLLEGAGVELFDLRAPAEPQVGEADQRLIEMTRLALGQASFDITDDVVRFLRQLLASKPAVMHAFLDDTNIKAGVAAVLAGVPRIILSFRSVAPINFSLHTPFMRPAYRALGRRSEVYFSANSEIGAEDYRDWLGASSLPITVIRNGVDFSNFNPVESSLKAAARAKFGIPSDVKVLGTIMRMSEEKQPLRWAEAALDISRRLPDVHFIMVGDGPMRSEVIEFLNNGRIGRRIHLPGHVRDVPSALACMDLFLLTSRLEGLPNALIEAQATGVPVVTTPAGGAVEALQDGVTGIVCRDWTASSISEACVRLLTDDVFRECLSKAAPAYVAQKFSIERMLRETLAIYES